MLKIPKLNHMGVDVRDDVCRTYNCTLHFCVNKKFKLTDIELLESLSRRSSGKYWRLVV